ncbi:LEM-3-like GIY-YIG domain-containing protein [Shewanella scandinavica]|uniref:LEM-3-like GIY-YIG domain-containing protein n=1 Tax=Shewanella scandinavica TaxID=3063538 RepID=UPI0031937A79
MKFSKSTKEHLGFYVYGLVDPRYKRIFYVGKASANDRAFNHLKVTISESKKQEIIDEIRAANLEPTVEILRYGLESEKVALEVEAAIIDAIGLENLTNGVRGHGVERGRLLASEVERLHGSKPVFIKNITDPYMLFFIHNSYSPTLSEQELYDSVRQFWHQVSENTRMRVTHPVALGVVEGVVVRAYSIAGWYPAGTTLSSRSFSGSEDKWEFVGQLLSNHPLAGRMLVEDDGTPFTASQKGYCYLPRRS